MPRRTYYVGVPSNRLAALAQDARVRWVGPIRPSDRADTQLRLDGLRDTARDAGGRIPAHVHFMPDMTAGEALAIAAALGGADAENVGAQPVVYARFPDGAFPPLFADDRVLFVELAGGKAVEYGSADRIQLDIDSSTTGRPLVPFRGAGIVVQQTETWLPDQTHPDLAPDISFPGGILGVSDHATHVAGIITSDGIFLRSQGVAPDAKIVSYYADLNAARYNAYTIDSVARLGVTISNDSWGPDFGSPGNYTTFAHNTDARANDGLVSVWAASNSRCWDNGCSGGATAADVIKACKTFLKCEDVRGPNEEWDCISPFSTGKNSITVGAIDGIGNRTHCASAFGPTDDGRLKPDLSAPGVSVFSTINGAAYGPMTGTSMAAPNVAGAAAVLRDAWNSVVGTVPTAATLKALLIHTAADLGNDGTTGCTGSDSTGAPTCATPVTLNDDGPGFRVGWGQPDVKAAYDVILDHRREELVYESSFDADGAAGPFKEYTFVVQPYDAGKQFRVTLAWDDVTAAVSASKQLVSDLDLILTAPNDWVYHPWELTSAAPSLAAVCTITALGDVDGDGADCDFRGFGPCFDTQCGYSPSADDTNNVEQIYVPSVRSDQVGIWTVRVTGTSLPWTADTLRPFTVILPFDHDVRCGDTLTGDSKLFADLYCLDSWSGFDGLVIGADNIDLDCQTHRLIGPGYGVGIELENRKDVTIQNCDVAEFTEGIAGRTVETCTFRSNRLMNNDTNLVLDGAERSVIDGNLFYAGRAFGVWLTGSSNLIFENELVLNETGILVFSRSPSVSSGNMIDHNRQTMDQTGVRIAAEGTRLTRNCVRFAETDNLAVTGAARQTFVRENAYCSAGRYDIALGAVQGTVADPASDFNICSTFGSLFFRGAQAWKDATAVSVGCTRRCGFECEPEEVPDVVDSSWNIFDGLVDVHVDTGFTISAEAAAPPGWTGIGSGVHFGVTPPEAPFHLIRDMKKVDLGRVRASSLRLFRLDADTGTYTLLPSGSSGDKVAGLATGTGTYRVFGQLCDVFVPPGPAAAGALHSAPKGSTVCLQAGATYDAAAFDLSTPDVTLDCQGAVLRGAGANACVRVHDAANIAVRDCVFDRCATGVLVDDAPGVRLSLNTVVRSGVGIAVHNSARAAVSDNVVCESTKADFQIETGLQQQRNTCRSGCAQTCPGLPASPASPPPRSP